MSRTPLKKAKPETRMFQSPSNLRIWGESISKDSSVRNGIPPNGIAPNGISPYDINGGYGVGGTRLTGTPSTSTLDGYA